MQWVVIPDQTVVMAAAQREVPATVAHVKADGTEMTVPTPWDATAIHVAVIARAQLTEPVTLAPVCLDGGRVTHHQVDVIMQLAATATRVVNKVSALLMEVAIRVPVALGGMEPTVEPRLDFARLHRTSLE